MAENNILKVVLFAMIAVYMGCKDNEKIILNDPQVYNKTQLEPWLREYYIEDEKLNNIEDNIIYNNCLEVWYKYQYEKNSEIKYFKQDDPFGYWEFINQDTLDKGIGAKTFKLTAPVPNSEIDKSKQSIVSYEFFDANNQLLLREETGVVENYRNIVIHNPRTGFFMSLFNSFPWPCIKFPIAQNKNWNWSFHAYGDNRLYKWEGPTLMNYSYSYLGESILNLPFGKVATSKFEALATNGIINNKLVYHFNSQIGFVKQEFYTHDGATIVLEAVDYVSKCEGDIGDLVNTPPRK